MASQYYKIVTDQVIVPAWAQTPGGGLPDGRIDTGYTRTRAEAQLIARMDRRQGGKPVITKERPAMASRLWRVTEYMPTPRGRQTFATWRVEASSRAEARQKANQQPNRGFGRLLAISPEKEARNG